jgi:hypothetical protein
MGDEMFYRYQQFLIDEARTTLATLLERPQPSRSKPVMVSLAPEVGATPESMRKAHADS